MGNPGSPVLEAPAPVVISDRLDVHEMNFCFRQLPFPRPGSVEIAYYFDGVYVHSRRLTLTQENPGEAREG